MKHTGQDAEIKNTLDFLIDMSNGFSQHLEEAKISKRAIVRDGENKWDKKIVLHAAWKEIPYGVAFVAASPSDIKEFGKNTYRAKEGEMKAEIIAKIDTNGMKIYFVDKEHYRNTDEVKWTEPTKLTKLVIYNKSVVENDGVEEINESAQLNEAKKKTSMKMEMDTNGNRVLRISSPEGSFTIQTNANLPDIHSRKIELDSKEAFDYVDEYLKKHGSTGKRQAVWNAYGVYSGFDKSMNESLEQLNENTKPINKKADGEFGYMAYWDKKRKLVAVYAPDTYEAKIRLMKFYKTKSTSDFSSVMKAEDDDGKQITHGTEQLDEAGDYSKMSKQDNEYNFNYKLLGIMKEEFESLVEKSNNKSAAVDILSKISGTRSDNFADWAENAGFSLDKMYKYAISQNTKGGLKANQEFGKDIMLLRVGDENSASYKKLESKVRKMIDESLNESLEQLNEDSVGIPVINALKMLMAAGLKETDFKEAYGKLQDKAVSNKEYITMDNVKAVAKKYGLTLGKNVFEAYSDKNPKIDIYVDGKYAVSTNWSKTTKEAIAKYKEKNPKVAGKTITAQLAEEVEQLDTKTAAAVEQSGEANDVDDMLPESLYQLDEFADVGVNDNKWQPEIEPIARGIYTFNIWKNKVKSEWYGYAYVTRNGKMLAYTTGKTRPEAILALKKLVKANSKSDTATKIDEIFGLFSGKPITPEPVETEIETWTPNLKSMGYGRYTLTFWKRKGASEWYGYVSNMRDGKMKIAYIEPESSESGIIRKLKAAVTQGVELSPVNP